MALTNVAETMGTHDSEKVNISHYLQMLFLIGKKKSIFSVQRETKIPCSVCYIHFDGKG